MVIYKIDRRVGGSKNRILGIYPLRLGQAGGRSLRLEQAFWPSAAARIRRALQLCDQLYPSVYCMHVQNWLDIYLFQFIYTSCFSGPVHFPAPVLKFWTLCRECSALQNTTSFSFTIPDILHNFCFSFFPWVWRVCVFSDSAVWWYAIADEKYEAFLKCRRWRLLFFS